MKNSWDSLSEAWSRLENSDTNTHWANYLGFYSSWLGGYFREPWAMTIPLDDHGFHRGDGVFEAIRIHSRAYIDLQAHLRRLQNSAAAIGMALPKSISEIETICLELARRCDADSAILRLYVTRGPGSFSPSPHEVVGHQIYAALTRLRPPDPKLYAQGCKAMISSVVAKEERWSQIKSCNYLQNVLMKKECHEKGFDLAISMDEGGRVCEGATENLLVVLPGGHVRVPRFDYTLRGTTVSVVMKMAETLMPEGLVKSVTLADLTLDDLRSAQEMAFVGTTLGVFPVRQLDALPVGDGRPGPIASRLNEMLMSKMAQSSELRTPF